MPYCYGNLDAHPDKYDATDYALSDRMMECWVNFVRFGNPNGAPYEPLPEDRDQWIRFNDAPTSVFEFGRTVRMVDDPYLQLHLLLDKYQDTLK